MRLKAVAALVSAVVVAGACSGGGDGDPTFVPPEGFSFLGTWQVHVDEAANCWASFDTRISITPESLTARANGTASVLNTDGWWHLGGTGPDVHSTLSGTLDPVRGTFSLRLWNGTDESREGHFDGVVTSATHLSGTFTDPDGVFRTSGGTHPCSAPAHADKDVS